MNCFEKLGHGDMSPDEAIKQAGEAAGTTGLLLWMIPLALGLWMNKRYAYALEVLQRPGVEKACGHLKTLYFARYGRPSSTW